MGKVSPLACLLRQVRVPGSNPGRCVPSRQQLSYLGHAVTHVVEFSQGFPLLSRREFVSLPGIDGQSDFSSLSYRPFEDDQC